MVNYSKLGYKNIEEYNIDFLETLLKTNHTYNYFVNWEKVFSKLENNIIEIGILNSLNKVDSQNVENKLKEILVKYPESAKIIPTILAIREENVDIFDIYNKTFKSIDFYEEKNLDITEILKFCKKTGLLNLFNEINDLYAYLVGAEVGLDTNARKNRSGNIFEEIVEDLLRDKIKNNSKYSLVAQESSIEIKRNKRVDFVIYENNKPKFLIECNFYSKTGSKPIETANAYIDLQKKITDSEMTFIWVTDGLGWKKMFNTFDKTSEHIEYVVNYNMLKNKFDKIF